MYKHKFSSLNFMRSRHPQLAYDKNIEIEDSNVRRLKIMLLITQYLLSSLENRHVNLLNIFKRCDAKVL